MDWLSVAIGEAAKSEKKLEARLNIDHLRNLSEATNVPLVLHGGSGVKQESVLAAIENGITKINVGTAVRQAYEKGLGENSDIEAAKATFRAELEDLICNFYKIEGSASRLATLLA